MFLRGLTRLNRLKIDVETELLTFIYFFRPSWSINVNNYPGADKKKSGPRYPSRVRSAFYLLTKLEGRVRGLRFPRKSRRPPFGRNGRRPIERKPSQSTRLLYEGGPRASRASRDVEQINRAGRLLLAPGPAYFSASFCGVAIIPGEKLPEKRKEKHGGRSSRRVPDSSVTKRSDC